MLSTSFDFLIVSVPLVVTFVVWFSLQRSRKGIQSPIFEKQTERPFGEWKPVKFSYPEFEAWKEFDVHRTKPIPYRPFRWGPNYSVTMGIRSMSWDSWIELDNTYLKSLEIRKKRVRERGDKVIRTLPGAEKAALEVCTELASYLAKRYPQVFKVTRVHDRDGLGGDSIAGENSGRVKTVEILPTGDEWDLDVDDPMMVAGLLIEDLAIMIEGADGQYYFRAGAICVPGFWRLEDKIGLPLKDIHLKGGVYQYKEKLQLSLDRFFRKLPVDKPVLRNNYFFQVNDDDIAWATGQHGDEDLFDQSTHMPRPEVLKEGKWQPPQFTTDMSKVYFRSERQSLRRMPKTGCICFTIRTYFLPVTEMVGEPGIPGRLAAAIRSWPEPIAEAKGKSLYADAMLPWLDDLHRKQVEAGVTAKHEKVDRYPY